MAEIQLHPRPSAQRPACVSCHGGLGSNDAALACDACGVPLHWECWRSLERCPSLGCGGKAKHSDRLTQQLARWGPVAPLVRDAEPARPAVPLLARLQSEPSAPPVEVSHAVPQVSHDSERLVGQFARWGGEAGAVIGLCLGYASAHPNGVVALAGGLLLGALLGVVGGTGLGALQGLIGVRDPQPEGAGWIGLMSTAVMASLGLAIGGPAVALVMALPTFLLAGRVVGFSLSGLPRPRREGRVA